LTYDESSYKRVLAKGSADCLGQPSELTDVENG